MQAERQASHERVLLRAACAVVDHWYFPLDPNAAEAGIAASAHGKAVVSSVLPNTLKPLTQRRVPPMTPISLKASLRKTWPSAMGDKAMAGEEVGGRLACVRACVPAWAARRRLAPLLYHLEACVRVVCACVLPRSSSA